MWRNSKGLFHRENDLPAIEKNNRYRAWYINGKLHRELGPAETWRDGDEWWYLNGIEYSPEKMPHFLYVNYLRWEYRKKNGI